MRVISRIPINVIRCGGTGIVVNPPKPWPNRGPVPPWTDLFPPSPDPQTIRPSTRHKKAAEDSCPCKAFKALDALYKTIPQKHAAWARPAAKVNRSSYDYFMGLNLRRLTRGFPGITDAPPGSFRRQYFGGTADIPVPPQCKLNLLDSFDTTAVPAPGSGFNCTITVHSFNPLTGDPFVGLFGCWPWDPHTKMPAFPPAVYPVQKDPWPFYFSGSAIAYFMITWQLSPDPPFYYKVAPNQSLRVFPLPVPRVAFA